MQTCSYKETITFIRNYFVPEYFCASALFQVIVAVPYLKFLSRYLLKVTISSSAVPSPILSIKACISKIYCAVQLFFISFLIVMAPVDCQSYGSISWAGSRIYFINLGNTLLYRIKNCHS